MQDEELRPGEYWVVQIDPETGRVTQAIEENWLLAPFRGLAEIVSDIATGRMRTRDWAFLAVVVALVTR